DQSQVRVDVVDGVDDHRSLTSAGGIEQVQPCGVAVEDAEPEAAQRVDVVRIVVENGGLETASEEEAADDLPDAADAGNDHGTVLGRDTARRAAALLAAAPLQQVGYQRQERRQHHRECDHQRENLVPVTRQNLGLPGDAEDDERELAPL